MKPYSFLANARLEEKFLFFVKKAATGILLSFLLLFTVPGNIPGQTVSFDYDSDGNMQSRYTVTLRSTTTITEEDAATALADIAFQERKITIYPNPTRGAYRSKLRL
jgi:hypothetical protein